MLIGEIVLYVDRGETEPSLAAPLAGQVRGVLPAPVQAGVRVRVRLPFLSLVAACAIEGCNHQCWSMHRTRLRITHR